MTDRFIAHDAVTHDERYRRTVKLGDDRFIVTHGLRRLVWADIYHYSMTASWPWFFACFGGIFLCGNAVFATLYQFGDSAIANQFPAGFWGAFFFSVETLATVGYGDMHPQTIYGHVVATLEIFMGMSMIALVTGVMFARFSRPRAMIMFARNPVIGPMNGRTTLFIRAANARQNIIVDASARLRMLRSEVSAEGTSIRRLHDLKLVRDQHPMFVLGWTLMHEIDNTSPLYGETSETLVGSGLVLTVDGIDETTSQSMLSRKTYLATDIRWQHRYSDLMSTDGQGIDHLDYTRFHNTEPL
jgi:inward rectifier potassium channel